MNCSSYNKSTKIQSGRVWKYTWLTLIQVGDQFLSAGSNDFKARVVGTTAWIASPAETVDLLDELGKLMAWSGNFYYITNHWAYNQREIPLCSLDRVHNVLFVNYSFKDFCRYHAVSFHLPNPSLSMTMKTLYIFLAFFFVVFNE